MYPLIVSPDGKNGKAGAILSFVVKVYIVFGGILLLSTISHINVLMFVPVLSFIHTGVWE